MTLPIHVLVSFGQAPDPLPQLYRQPHDREIMSPGPSAVSPARNYRGAPTGTARDTKGLRAIPEPFRLLPDHQTPLNCDCQRLIRELNPLCRDDVTDDVLDQAWILANNTGLGLVGRKNCRTGEYMNDPNAKWPAFHAPIVCGGALFKGDVSEGYLYIESILTNAPIPSAAEVLSKPWLWFWLVEVNADGVVTYMTLAGTDGQRHPVRVPLITRLPVYVPLAWLEKLPADFNPAGYDPRQMGLMVK